jgi:enoyl-[acyl-carrier-protein] reductase (NADH)
LRPVPGSLMEDLLPPPREAVEAVYRKVVPYLAKNGMSSAGVAAGCARCQACSGIGAFERIGGGISDGRPSLPLFADR